MCRQEMEEWYSALLIPLKDLGWIEHNDEISPGEGIVRSCKSLKGERRKPETNPHQRKAASVHTGQGGFAREEKVRFERERERPRPRVWGEGGK